MRLIVNTKELRSALSIAARFVPARTPTPILQCVLLTANNGGIDICAQSMQSYAGVVVHAADVAVHGRCAIPAARLVAALDHCADETTTIESDERKCRVASGRFEASISAFDPATWPISALMHDAETFKVDGDALKSALERTVACCGEADWYATNGVFLDATGGKLHCVATNTRVLACQLVGEFSGKIEPSIAPQDAVRSLIPGISGQCRIAVSKAAFIVMSGQNRFAARLLEGRFPNWRAVLPDTSHSVGIQAGAFREALSAATVCMERGKLGWASSVIVKITPGLMRVYASESESGVAACEIPLSGDCQKFEGSFTPEYLLTAIAALPAESTLEFSYSDGESAVTFKTQDEYLAILMPLSRDR